MPAFLGMEKTTETASGRGLALAAGAWAARPHRSRQLLHAALVKLLAPLRLLLLASLLASPSLILIAGRGKKAEAEQGHGCRVTLWSGGGGRGYQRVVFLRSTSCDVGQDLPILVSLLTCLLAHMKPQLVALRAACQVHSALWSLRSVISLYGFQGLPAPADRVSQGQIKS